ncbi:DUF6192 family protein [Streptomyces ehimensis]|uniref:DUF6192 family protein n=1 Tax=Streptomyces ehimensis TaxID=68195 RepID=A0ABV9BUP8_9ACTN
MTLGEDELGVEVSLREFAEAIGLSFHTVRTYRWVASRWPKEHRQGDASYTVHRILADIEDEDERFAAILTPSAGKSRWTPDAASQWVGRQVESLETPQEKISAIRTLARDDQIAAAVTTDLLKRPQVAAKVPVRVVEQFTPEETVATTAAAGLLRHPGVAFKAMSEDSPNYGLAV